MDLCPFCSIQLDADGLCAACDGRPPRSWQVPAAAFIVTGIIVVGLISAWIFLEELPPG